jgi:outer membrane receptor protein involved in Fe transport
VFLQLLRRAGLVVGLVLLFLPAFVHAQATGTMTGRVTDATDGVLPGAHVTIANEATADSRSTVTNTEGVFLLPLVPPGTYRLRVARDGFNAREVHGVAVPVAGTARVDVVLALPALTEVIIDAVPMPRLETMRAGLGLVMSQPAIVDLPLNGRNFTQLGTLMPGVVAPPPTLGGAAGDATPGGFGNATGGFHVNGMRNQSNNFLLDGAPNNDTFNTGFVLRPPPDAIEEFTIQTHGYGAEYGRNAGSVVNVVTRSGATEWRGSGWWFNRDDALEARNRFAVATPALSQHQAGAAGGGRLRTDRAFVYAHYEGFRNTRGTTDTRTVLSGAQRAGDFTGRAPLRDPLTGQPFPDNRIPAARIDPVAARLLSEYVPLPNQPADRFTHSPNVEDRRHQGGARVDVRAAGHQLLGRVLAAHTDQRNPLGAANFSPAGNIALATLFDALASDTWVVGPDLLNVVRVAVNRIDARPTVTSGIDPRHVGFAITPSNALALGLPNITVNGFFTLGDAQQPFASRTNDVFTIADDVIRVVGGSAHVVKGGVELRRDRVGLAFINRPNGNFTFNGQYTGNAAADFLLGLPQQYRQASGDPRMNGHTWTTSVYLQDEWRATRDVTVSAGVRYERAAPFVERDDKLNAFHPGQQSVRFPQAPLGLVYPGDPAVPRGTYRTDGDNVAPRLGLAWDIGGEGTSVVRAGWGLFYDTLAAQGDFFQNGTLAPPFQPLTEVNYPLTSAAPHLQAPLDGIGGARDFPPGLIFIGWGPEFATPVAQHYHLSLQRDLARRVAMEVGYVGSRGSHLPMFMDVNPTTPITSPVPRQGPRLLADFSLVRPTLTAARSWYDALQVSARIHRWGGLAGLAAYTWSHAIDHVSGLNIGGEPRPMLPVSLADLAAGEGPSIDAALAREKGDALFDARHRVVFSASYGLPAFEGRRGLVRHALGGWSINAIVQAQSGFALTVTEPVDVALTSSTNRPNVTCDPNARGARTVAQWFDTSCFSRLTLPADAGKIGDAGRGIVRGPGFARTDLSLVRRIDLPRQQHVELRVEAFNLFDQDRLGNPGVSIGTPTFGQITSADDGRIVQLGVKWSWR